jgi:hypothetical protein
MVQLVPVKTNVFNSLIFSRVKPKHKFFIDVGCSDGISFDPTFGINNDMKFSGIFFEADKNKYNKLCNNFPRNDLIKVNDLVTPNNIINHLEKNNVPKDIDAVSIDIDGYDYFIIKTLLENGYLAQSFCVECNTIFPPGINWTLLYKEGYFWSGNTHFLGCSLSLYDKLMKKFGYEIIHYDWENAYYVKRELYTQFFNFKENSLQTAWEKGYWKRPDRGLPGGFEWNDDFVIANLDPRLQLHFVRNHSHIRTHKENEEFYLFHDNEFDSLDENKKKVLGLL